jgi:hypothetical protein
MVETIEPEGPQIKDPIDIPPQEPTVPTTQPTQPKDISKQKFITDYVGGLQRVCQYNSLDLPSLNPLLPFLHLDEGMMVRVKPLSKQQFIDIVRLENEDLAFVMENTDLSEEISDKIILNRTFNWGTDLPEYIDLLRADFQGTAFSQVRPLEQLTENNVFIPNLACLSYFMQQGALLREYLPHAPESAAFDYFKGLNHPSGAGRLFSEKKYQIIF